MPAVKVWMLQNQLGRRNLNDYQRSEIALQLEDLLKGQAKVRQLAGLRQYAPDEDTVKQNSAEREAGQSRDAVAQTSGVSHNTIDKVKTIRAAAIPEVQDMARSGAVSIHAASQIAALPETKPH